MDIKNFFSEVLLIKNENLISEALKVAEIQHFQKGEKLIQGGEKPKYIMFLFSENSITRGYYYSQDGKEFTDCFQFKIGTPVMPDNDFLIPAPIYMEALTETDVLCIPISDLFRMQKRYLKEITFLEIRLINDSWNMHLELKRIGSQYDAMKRYLWFLEKYPGLIDAVNNKYIASYLNMTPVTLSRLRRELKDSKEKEKNPC